MSARSLLHYVSLDNAGGVELQFADFIATAEVLAGWRSDVIACGRAVHPMIAERLPESAALRFEKYAGPLKWPKWPRTARRAWQRHLVESSAADGVLIWNRLRDSVDTLKAAGPERCVYWERGAAWFAEVTPAKTWFIEHVAAILANSVAAKRMLELRWGYAGQIRVVPNALRPALRPSAFLPRSAPGGTWRLGLVARLAPIKGAAIALHALAILRGRGQRVVLEVAGTGPERPSLEALAQRLGLAESVIFQGLVSDMVGFYRRIDLLIHPALREPFGQIAVEANAYGVPAVVTAVDGLVEAVADDVSGLCLAPTEPVSVYAELGGAGDDLPPYVYHPFEDTIDRPRVLGPDVLADTMENLMGDGPRYERLSRGAIERVAAEFDFERHVRGALGAIDGYLSTGELHSA